MLVNLLRFFPCKRWRMQPLEKEEFIIDDSEANRINLDAEKTEKIENSYKGKRKSSYHQKESREEQYNR